MTQQNSFVGHILLELVKFSCNYEKMLDVTKSFIFVK